MPCRWPRANHNIVGICIAITLGRQSIKLMVTERLPLQIRPHGILIVQMVVHQQQRVHVILLTYYLLYYSQAVETRNRIGSYVSPNSRMQDPSIVCVYCVLRYTRNNIMVVVQMLCSTPYTCCPVYVCGERMVVPAIVAGALYRGIWSIQYITAAKLKLACLSITLLRVTSSWLPTAFVYPIKTNSWQ